MKRKTGNNNITVWHNICLRLKTWNICGNKMNLSVEWPKIIVIIITIIMICNILDSDFVHFRFNIDSFTLWNHLQRTV